MPIPINAGTPNGPYTSSDVHGNYNNSVCKRQEIHYIITDGDIDALSGGQTMLQFTLNWDSPFRTIHYAVMECLEIVSIVGGSYNPFTYQISLGVLNKTTGSVDILLYYAGGGAQAGDEIRLHCCGFSD